MKRETAASRPKMDPNPESHWDPIWATAGEAAFRKHDIGFANDQEMACSILVDSRLHGGNVMAGPRHQDQKREYSLCVYLSISICRN